MGTVATYLGGRNEVTELKLLGRKVDFGLKPQYLTIYMLESSCLFLFGMDEIFYQIDIVRQNLFEAGLGKENVFDRRTNRSIGARATDRAVGKGREGWEAKVRIGPCLHAGDETVTCHLLPNTNMYASHVIAATK